MLCRHAVEWKQFYLCSTLSLVSECGTVLCGTVLCGWCVVVAWLLRGILCGIMICVVCVYDVIVLCTMCCVVCLIVFLRVLFTFFFLKRSNAISQYRISPRHKILYCSVV